jgi:hypothetical protein
MPLEQLKGSEGLELNWKQQLLVSDNIDLLDKNINII